MKQFLFWCAVMVFDAVLGLYLLVGALKEIG